MNDISLLSASLTTNVPIKFDEFVINFLLTSVLSFLLSLIYTKFGNSLSNRKEFSKTFVLISTTTMLIISIVKSSLALSLGLVGALSIVRFRSAIKEPEELAYLFINIAIGLGFGANQRLITLAGISMIGLLTIVINNRKDSFKQNMMTLVLSSTKNKQFDLDKIIEILTNSSEQVSLERYEEIDDSAEAVFLVSLKKYDQFSQLKTSLEKSNKNLNISFIGNSTTS